MLLPFAVVASRELLLPSIRSIRIQEKKTQQNNIKKCSDAQSVVVTSCPGGWFYEYVTVVYVHTRTPLDLAWGYDPSCTCRCATKKNFVKSKASNDALFFSGFPRAVQAVGPIWLFLLLGALCLFFAFLYFYQLARCDVLHCCSSYRTCVHIRRKRASLLVQPPGHNLLGFAA